MPVLPKPDQTTPTIESQQKDIKSTQDTGFDSSQILFPRQEDFKISLQQLTQDEKIKEFQLQILEEKASNLQFQQETLEEIEILNKNFHESIENTKQEITLNLKQQLKALEKSFQSKIISEVESIVGRQSQPTIQVIPPHTEDLQQSIEDLRIIMLKLQQCFMAFVEEQQNTINQLEIFNTLWKERDGEISNSLTQIQDRLTLVWQGMDFLSQEYWKGQNTQTRRNSEILTTPRKKFIIF